MRRPRVKGVLALLLAAVVVAGRLAPAGAEGKRPHLVMVISEDEYRTDETLPAFADRHLARDFKVTLVFGDRKDPNNLLGIEALKGADVALFSVRRRTPPKAQLDVIRQFVAGGKGLVALRTSSHGFSRFKGKGLAPGRAEWPEFDRDVLGGNYTGHYGTGKPGAVRALVRVVPAAAGSPLLHGVPKAEEFAVASWLYKTSPLSKKAVPLLVGRVPGQAKTEPVAWTHTGPGGGRVFYTSLGHPDDFALPAFRRLLFNATHWASGSGVPERMPGEK
jgi:type 1 glutamine amidotransferase